MITYDLINQTEQVMELLSVDNQQIITLSKLLCTSTFRNKY